MVAQHVEPGDVDEDTAAREQHDRDWSDAAVSRVRHRSDDDEQQVDGEEPERRHRRHNPSDTHPGASSWAATTWAATNTPMSTEAGTMS